MKLLTISDHPLLIARLLRAHEARQHRRTWWRRLLGRERAPRTHVVKLPGGETIYSPGR